MVGRVIDADDRRRRLPAVQRLLEEPAAAVLIEAHGRLRATAAIRAILADLRQGTVVQSVDAAAILDKVAAQLAAARRPALCRVINATGVVLHTNLGRAPLAAPALAAVMEAAQGYCPLEYDLDAGSRGTRGEAVEALLCELTGAAAAIVVNNGAAAILLTLAAVASGGEVIVSRGELVEIGGGFRIPDVIAQGGARLTEVGATNRTRASDYAAAIGPATRALLKVHQSNFRQIGFTAETGIAAIRDVAAPHGLPVIADLGSGLLHPVPGIGEPTLTAALADGADIVTCSGDKLLGGPQAGLILGSAAALAPLRRHPLLRAVRSDKMTLAALEATLRLHRDDASRVPVMRMLGQDAGVVRRRAERLLTLIGDGALRETIAYAGGGALPGEGMPSWGVTLCCKDPASAARRLRLGDPAIVGRIEAGRLLLDLFTVTDEDVAPLAAAIAGLA